MSYGTDNVDSPEKYDSIVKSYSDLQTVHWATTSHVANT